MSYPTWTLSRGAVDANTEQISLAVAKLHLRVTSNTENAAINSLCTAARQSCEAFTNRWLASSNTNTLKLASFPCQAIVLPVGVANVANVSVSYIDANGTTQTWSNTNYTVYQRADSFPEILPKYGTPWPATRCETDAVTVTFDAVAAASDAQKAGMLLLIGHLYEHREAVIVGTIVSTLPLAVDSLWSPSRIFWL